MFTPGDKVIVAVSGGPDSVALLHALHALKDRLGISLHVAHLNHGIRGKEADKEAEFVRQLAADLGLESTVEKADVPAVKKLLRLSTEEAARKVRYEFLDRVADQIGATKIATAHTKDDQAETVLMNLIRGAGLEGLTGIPPVRGCYVRPLLSVTRKEVEDYCAHQNLEYKIDPSNLRFDYRRNRIRLEFIPLLESHYNPAVKSRLASTAEILRDEAAFLAETAQAFLAIATVKNDPSEVVFDLNRFTNAPIALRRRCLRMAIEMVKGDLHDVEFRQIERVINRLETGENFTITLPSGAIYAKREEDILKIFRVEPEPEAPIIACELPIPGCVEIPELKITVTSKELAMPVDFHRPPATLDVMLDRDHVKGKLIIRNLRPGDRIRPLGMSEDKKLQDIFVNAKLPRRSRSCIPIIADEEKIIWVVGFTLSDEVKITESTRRVLHLACTSTE
ncbi:MAG: tRNA lysidine(34) synthetase TilS [Armatimonadota bacterium]|nr:tRNA lysidine(34) synthetase TilS [Armatimonadota bacterium]